MPIELAQRWDSMKKDNPRLRIRDAATELGVSEGELLCTRLGNGVTRLTHDAEGILNLLPGCGALKSIVRNDACVHEKTGVFGPVRRMHGPVAVVTNGAIDLRLFLNHWSHAFFVEDERAGHALTSVQFFDPKGGALLKAYATQGTDIAAFGAIETGHMHESQLAPEFIAPVLNEHEKPLGEIDVPAFQSAWLGMKDTHDFNMILRKMGLSRTQALVNAPDGMATRITTNAGSLMLTAAQEDSLPVMVFTGNPGVIQIHSGPVHRLGTSGPWFNVMDDEFNLHLMEQFVSEAWIVRKPTSDGLVNSLELYDAGGREIALFFGVRKPGVAENPSWTQLLDTLPSA